MYREKEEMKLSNLNELPSPQFPVHSNAFALSSHGEDPFLQKAASMTLIKTPEKLSPLHHTPSSENKIFIPNVHYDHGVCVLKDLKLVKYKSAEDCKKSFNTLDEAKRTIVERTQTEINLKGDATFTDRNLIYLFIVMN